MSAVKQKKQRTSTKDRENERVIKCLQHRLAWCNHTGQCFSAEQEQYSLYPRALSGIPHKSLKSQWTEKLEVRYKTSLPLVFSNTIINEWVPQTVIIDAMFIINTKLLRNTNTVSQYTKLLFGRFIKEHFNCGVHEVHVIFDKPCTSQFNSKQFEQSRCDNVHDHILFDPNSTLPTSWCQTLQCRQCKHSLIEAIGLSFFQYGKLWIQQHQTLVLAGCLGNDMAWIIKCGESTVPQPEPLYFSNAIEGDQILWHHATMCSATTVLLYSPDTDVYNIGLTKHSLSSTKQYIVQLNVPHSIQKST